MQEKNRIIADLEEKLRERDRKLAVIPGLKEELRLLREKYDNDMREK